MNYILNISTATEEAQVSIARDGILLQSIVNNTPKDHASFLQPAIRQLSKDTSILLSQLSAIAVTAGPGSYTGLRVGMSSAKGLCYALNKPLITLNTLEVLAASAIWSSGDHELSKESLLCPMIDARRMEVFTAVYDLGLNIIATPCAMVLNEGSFEAFMQNELVFFGNGAEKWRSLCKHPKASFINIPASPKAMSKLSYELSAQKRFTQLADSQPIYLKEFYDVRRM